MSKNTIAQQTINQSQQTMKSLLLVIWISIPIVIVAQQSNSFPPPEIPLNVEAVKAQEKITIDGKLDEPAWQSAKVITDFFRVEPRQGGTILYPTYVKVLFDKKNLYFGVFAKDSLGKYFLIFVAPFTSMSNTTHFPIAQSRSTSLRKVP